MPDRRALAAACKNGLPLAGVLAAVAALFYMATAMDFLVLTRPLVVGILGLAGVEAEDQTSQLIVNGLKIPWSRDCAGVNGFVLLLVLTLWAHRKGPWKARFWSKLALVFPLALLANAARVLTIIGYRELLYPAVETPPTHYLISFLWLVPAVALLLPRRSAEQRHLLFETLYLGIVLAWLAPILIAPGGLLIAGATLVLLMERRFAPTPATWLVVCWSVAGACIVVANMESLWLPWLLCCPWFAPAALLLRPAQIVLLLATVSIFSMQEFAPWIAVPAAIFEIARSRKPETPSAASTAQRSSWAVQIGLCVILLAPFTSAVSSSFAGTPEKLPTMATIERFAPESYSIRLPGQPVRLQLTWFNTQGGGRHHAVEVCMKYRGIDLDPVAHQPAVQTDGKYWMREFFVVRGELLTTYRDYLMRTLLPFSPAGAHLIVSAPCGETDAAAFDEAATLLARTAAGAHISREIVR